MKRVLGALLVGLAFAPGVTAIAAAAQPPRAAQEEFVPVTDADIEQLPAAPLVMTAYAVAWVLVFLYVWSIWRRLSRVERELAELAARGGAKGR